MPEPVDPMLRSRIADMEKGITSVWTSIGITSSPFVPPLTACAGGPAKIDSIPARTTAPMPRVSRRPRWQSSPTFATSCTR